MKAFPTSNWNKMAPLANGYDEGMDLRDYFAAKAMQALIEKFDESPWDIADQAYDYAQAMMKEREERK